MPAEELLTLVKHILTTTKDSQTRGNFYDERKNAYCVIGIIAHEIGIRDTDRWELSSILNSKLEVGDHMAIMSANDLFKMKFKTIAKKLRIIVISY